MACQATGVGRPSSSTGLGGLEGVPPPDTGQVKPAPVGTPVPVAPPNRGVFTELDLGYLVVAAGGVINGVVAGPQTLIGNTGAALIGNTGAALIGNTGAALIGNTGAALTQNTGTGLIGNTGAAYRVGAVQAKVANGFVYLTAPDERFYVDAERKLYGTVTDADGKFALAGPATDSVVVNVLLKGNRRLSAVVVPGATGSLDVDLASTLVTEFIRSKAIEHGFGFSQTVATSEARASLGRLVALTKTLFDQDAALGWLQTEDFAINNLPLLRQHYVAAFGSAADHALSDEWTAFLKLAAGNAAAPEARYRPLALTTVEAGIPVGNAALGVAADGLGNVFVADLNRSSAAIRQVSGQGTMRTVFVKARSGDDSLAYVAHLAMTPDGKLLIPDGGKGLIALLDSVAPVAAQPIMDFNHPELWTNPAFLLDTYYVTGGALAVDVALDDDPEPGMYFVDPNAHAVWYVPKALSASPAEGSIAPFAGVPGEVPGATDPVPAADLSGLKLNQPSAVTFHKRKDGRRFLYVTDNGDHTIVEIDLDSPDPKAVRRVAGEVPPWREGVYRRPLCYTPAEEGGDPLAAHLRFPQKVLFDANDRLVIADGDNNLVRVADIYSASPRIWTVAGIAQPDDDDCGLVPKIAPFAYEDGEARKVALGAPMGMALDLEGNLLIADQTNRVRKLWLSFLK